MPQFTIQVPDGRKVTVQADSQDQALSGVQDWYAKNPVAAAAAPAVGNGGTSNPNDPYFQGLALPGQQQPPGAPPVNTVPPNLHFGPNSGDTLNPLPALDAMGSEVLKNIPIAGPKLNDMAGGNDPATMAATAKNVAANPEAATAGRVIGAVAPYAVASEVPLLNQALGFSGPWWQRLAMTAASQTAINTGDNMAHGQSPEDALRNSVIPSLATVPLALMGPAGKASGARQEAVQTLTREGVPLTAGQQRGSNAMKQMESQMGGVAAQSFRDKQLSAYTKAALSRAGIVADSAAPEVMDKAFTNIGNRFDQLAAMTKIKVDPQLQNDVIGAVTKYQDIKGESKPILDNLLNRIGTLAQQNAGAGKRFVTMGEGDKQFQWSWDRSPDTGMAAVKFGDNVYAAKTHAEAMQKAIAAEGDGIRAELNAHPERHLGYEVRQPSQPLHLKGDNYKALATDIRDALTRSSDPEMIGALKDLKEALDDGVARSLSGQTLAAWQKTRQQYANMFKIVNAVKGGGQYAAQGLITPEALRTAAAAGNAKNYVRGYGDLNELARAGVIAMGGLPDSGTASRLAPLLAAQGGVTHAIATGGHDLLTSAAMAAGGTVLPFAAGRAMLSPAGRALLAKGTKVPAVMARGLAPLLAPPSP